MFFCFVLPKPQGHIGLSIKEGEQARFLFLAREPDSERRYRPEAHGSAQKGFCTSAEIPRRLHLLKWCAQRTLQNRPTSGMNIYDITVS